MENKYYWRYYRWRQKAEKLEEELEKLKKEVERYRKCYEVTGNLLSVMVRFYRGDVVNADKITRYKNALRDLKTLVDAETYNWLAPVCGKAIAELERRSTVK